MKRVCVYCGSSSGANPVHREAAEKYDDTAGNRGAFIESRYRVLPAAG